MKFDRIDVSNISDENYVGLENCLKYAKPLLNPKNPHAKLITTLMNWVQGTEFASTLGDSSLFAKVYNTKKITDNDRSKIIAKLLEDDEK